MYHVWFCEFQQKHLQILCDVDPDIMDKLLKESPFSLVKFQVYSKRKDMKYNDRRLNRVRNKNKIPFGPWARTVTESMNFTGF